MIALITFVILAAICKSLAETIAFHEGGIFHGNKFFDITVSRVIPYTKYPFNGYHVFNSLMIVFFILAACYAPHIAWYYTLAIGGIIFDLTFNFFWNKIFN